MIVTANSGVTTDDVNCLHLTNLVQSRVGSKYANMHHQRNDATGTVSTSCTEQLSQSSVADGRMMHAVRND